MTRRSLFKILFGCAAAPVAAPEVRPTLVYNPMPKSVRFVGDAELKHIVSWDVAMAEKQLRAESKLIAKIIAEHAGKYYKLHSEPYLG